MRLSLSNLSHPEIVGFSGIWNLPFARSLIYSPATLYQIILNDLGYFVDTVILQRRTPIALLGPTRKMVRVLASPHFARRIQLALRVSPAGSHHAGRECHSNGYIHFAQTLR